jgi:hypothetical protein
MSSISARDFAEIMWESICEWPPTNGTNVRQNFSGCFSRSTDEVIDELVYFMAFATDYAFWLQLDKTPHVRDSVRDVFIRDVEHFGKEHRCAPFPAGDWLGDTLMWMPGEMPLDEVPVSNVRRRFELYGRALSRRHDRSAGERVAHILAALCGTMDIGFIVYATPLFLERWRQVRMVLGSFEIRAS